MDEEFKGYLDTQFAGMDTQFADIDVKFAEVRAELEHTETTLLTEFWKWSRSSDSRTRRVEHSDATTVERLSAVEERVFALERKAQGSKD